MKSDGSCYTKIIQEVLVELKTINFKNHIVLRSTIPPGLSDKLDCFFMHEFCNFLSFQNHVFRFIFY